jgi:SAM-dependent methyltransferase
MNEEGVNSREDVQRSLLRRAPWLRWLKPPAPALNTGRLLQRVLEGFSPNRHRLLDLGCGGRHIEGAVRCDLTLTPPGVCADAARLPFRSGSFDCVVTTAVLEHVPYPQRVVREIHRVLRPGGTVYIEVPFLEGFHADPDDYHRFTFRGLEVLLRRFEILDREVCVGPSSALTWILREFPAAWFSSPRWSLFAKFITAWLVSPIRFLDYIVAHRPGAFRIAGGLSILARRRRA